MNGRPATTLEREANLRALANLRRMFPRLPQRDVGDFLINCTAYPFAPLTYCINVQCAELSREAHKDVTRAYRISNESLCIKPTRAERRASRPSHGGNKP